MTLTLKDINSAATGSFSYNHFSKISILQETYKAESHGSPDLILRQRFKRTHEKSCKRFTMSSGRDLCDARDLDENKLLAHLLSTDTDSVLEFSITSDRPHHDSEFQLFTPPMLEGNTLLTLEELNAQIALLLAEYCPRRATNFLSELTLTLITQAVQLNQAFARFKDIRSSDKNVTTFVQLCNKIMRDLWLRSLSNSIEHMHTMLLILERYEGQYNKVEVRETTDPGIGTVLRKWSLLNYFPPVLINSLKFKVESSTICDEDCKMIANSELFKIAFVTLAIESSKGFAKMINILIELCAYESLTNHIVVNFLELLLACTIDTRVGEIMIGLEQVIKRWITGKESTEPLTRTIFHQWAQRVMITYKIQQEQEIRLNGTQDEADVMFDKWEVAKLFVSEILQFIQPEPTSQARSDTLGWLTVFDEYYDAASNPNDCIREPSQFELDSISIKSIPQRRTTAKRDAIKRWASYSKDKVTQSCHRIKRRFQRVFHMHTNHALITSVRYYSALNGRNYEYHYPDETPGFTSDQCAHVQRLTQKLYKSEQRGKRKRDALRVIFM